MDKGFKALVPPPGKGVLAEVEKPIPCIMISNKELSEVKDWELGKEYSIKFRMVSREEEEDGEVEGRFELVGTDNEKAKPEAEDAEGGDEEEA
jgi:hypothetical protein